MDVFCSTSSPLYFSSNTTCRYRTREHLRLQRSCVMFHISVLETSCKSNWKFQKTGVDYPSTKLL